MENEKTILAGGLTEEGIETEECSHPPLCTENQHCISQTSSISQIGRGRNPYLPVGSVIVDYTFSCGRNRPPNYK